MAGQAIAIASNAALARSAHVPRASLFIRISLP
jgi:hypothetical protein